LFNYPYLCVAAPAVFAPTNDAFAALPQATVDFLGANPDILAQVLLYHAVDGEVLSTAIGTDPISVPTLLAGAEVVARRHISGSWCWLFNIGCTETVTINDSTVVIPDVLASNGVIHAIDKVLMPPGLPLLDIVDTAIDQHLDTLVAALSAANLVDVLLGPGPFTVFAPSEEAWHSLPAGLLETLLKPENMDLLTDILQYHVFSGAAVDSGSISPDTDITMVNGDAVRLDIGDGGKVLVNDATVIAADVGTINGIVHVIDSKFILSMF
jgi:transforming growth factor-beta-induced protein